MNDLLWIYCHMIFLVCIIWYCTFTYPNEVLKGFKNFEQKHMFCSINGGGGCDWSIRTLLPLTITFLWWCPMFWCYVKRKKHVFTNLMSTILYNVVLLQQLIYVCYKYMIIEINYNVGISSISFNALNHMMPLDMSHLCPQRTSFFKITMRQKTFTIT